MKKYLGLFLVATVILLTSCAKPAPMVNLGNVDAYAPSKNVGAQTVTPFQQALLKKLEGQTNAISDLAQGIQSSTKKPLATVKTEPKIKTVTTVVPANETSKRLTALEKRMSVVEKKATANSNAIQSTTMRVAELEILSEVSSQYMACVVGNFDIGQSDITEELGCKIVNECLPYFKKGVKEKGDDYRIVYIFGYGDVGGRADLTKALSNARAENTMNFLMNNACVADKTTITKIVEGGPTKMFGKVDYNRCVVIVASVVFHSTSRPVVLPTPDPKKP